MSPLKANILNEEELIKACISGDRKGQKELYALHAPKMMTVCRRFARHNAEAQDMMQEGFIKMFKSIDKFQFQGSFEGWLRRIMVNTALKKVARKSFTNERIGIDETYEGALDAHILSDMHAEEILKMVQELPEGYRIVFNLYVLEGLSHKEIAEQLNIGESTSRSQLVKARRILQNKVLDSQKIAV